MRPPNKHKAERFLAFPEALGARSGIGGPAAILCIAADNSVELDRGEHFGAALCVVAPYDDRENRSRPRSDIALAGPSWYRRELLATENR